MSESHVKTANLQGRDPMRNMRGEASWVFCSVCYGNKVNADGETTDSTGRVCPCCDGDGALWRVDNKTEEMD